ncbi:hypothetical protein EDC96DRAFT_138822 [Choanephora cucurbitarum]|nr:hypothetical protein EDC96DRAFT_138822 [Choanephora cucurbitarum]
MPRFISLVTGLAVATAATYKLREHLVNDQDNIQSRLENAKSTLEQAVSEQTYSKPSAYLSDSQRYVSDRLVPSGKNNGYMLYSKLKLSALIYSCQLKLRIHGTHKS